jgi:AsmA-like C-terminal region
LRFTDTYPRLVGGQMWAAMDPPTPSQAPQEGLLNVRDFTVRGESALDKIASGGVGLQSGGVEFSRMRVDFIRSPGRFTVRDAVVRGPAVGATMDGVLDYASNEVRLRGTFVPLFGLNNMFGQIPIVGLFLGGDKEGLVGITFEVVGPPGSPVLRVNPLSPLAPGLVRKVFEFPSSVPGERYPEARSSYADRDR